MIEDLLALEVYIIHAKVNVVNESGIVMKCEMQSEMEDVSLSRLTN